MRSTHITDLQTAFDDVFDNIEFFLEELEEIQHKARSEQGKLNGSINLSNLRNIKDYFRDLTWRLQEQTEFASRLADEAEACIEYITEDHNVTVTEAAQ